MRRTLLALTALALLAVPNLSAQEADAVRRKIAQELTQHAEWCSEVGMLDPARLFATEAQWVDENHERAAQVEAAIPETAEEPTPATRRSYPRRRASLGRSLARPYLYLASEDGVATARRDGYLQRALAHDSRRARRAFEAAFAEAIEAADVARIRRFLVGLQATDLAVKVLLPYHEATLTIVLEPDDRATLDNPILDLYRRSPDEVAALHEKVWRGAFEAGEWKRTRKLLGAIEGVGDDKTLARILAEVTDAELRAEVRPGNRFTVDFPELGRTMNSEKHIMRMEIVLPKEYDPAKTYPLFLSLGGGNGVHRPAMGILGSHKHEFVALGLPYPWDPERPTARTPHPTILWEPYTKMLARFDELVPNTDPERQLVFGFSNGAHSMTGLIAVTEGAFAERFGYYIFHEGGMYFRLWEEEHWPMLADRHFLWTAGSTSLARMSTRWNQEAVRRGVDSEIFVYEGGHTMNPEVSKASQEWIGRKILGNE